MPSSVRIVPIPLQSEQGPPEWMTEPLREDGKNPVPLQGSHIVSRAVSRPEPSAAGPKLSLVAIDKFSGMPILLHPANSLSQLETRDKTRPFVTRLILRPYVPEDTLIEKRGRPARSTSCSAAMSRSMKNPEINRRS